MISSDFIHGSAVDQETPTKREGLWGALLGFGYLTFLALIPYLVLRLVFPQWNESILTSMAQLVTVAGVLVGMYFISRRTIPALLQGFRGVSPKMGLIYGLVMYGVSMGWALIDIMLFGEPVTNANQASLIELAQLSPVVFFLLVAIAAPIVEECIFRYYVYKTLEPKSPLLGMLISTLVFALIHLIPSITAGTFLQDLRTLPHYFIPSLIFAIAYFRTKRFAVPVYAHITYNIITVIAMFAL